MVGLARNYIHAQLAAGPNRGKGHDDLLIPRIKFFPEDKKMPFEMERIQFPIKVCFGITANRSQGQTYQFVGINLTHQMFAHGQAYVAMSRVGSAQRVKLFHPKNCPSKGYLKNVVYPEVLQSKKIPTRRSAKVFRAQSEETKPFYPQAKNSTVERVPYPEVKKLTTERLDQAGFVLSVDTPADGNCAVHAILDQMM